MIKRNSATEHCYTRHFLFKMHQLARGWRKWVLLTLSTDYTLHPFILLWLWIIKATKGGDLSCVSKAQDFPAPEVFREAQPLDIYVLCDKIKGKTTKKAQVKVWWYETFRAGLCAGRGVFACSGRDLPIWEVVCIIVPAWLSSSMCCWPL